MGGDWEWGPPETVYGTAFKISTEGIAVGEGRARGMNRGTARKRQGQPDRYSAGLRRARDAERKLERELGVWSEESEEIAGEGFAVQCQACADEAEWEKGEQP